MQNTSAARPLVSVVVPVFKTQALLPRCLDSLLGQSLQEIEVICVDDASPDGCAAILAGYAARDARVRVVTGTNLALLISAYFAHAGATDPDALCAQILEEARNGAAKFELVVDDGGDDDEEL